MNITGAHAIIYSTNADADRALLRDVFKLKHVDAVDTSRRGQARHL
jgi:hypothetical protein